MQDDGNLVEYDAGKPVWAGNTARHSGSDLEAQSDGNLVVYALRRAPIWASSTNGHAGSVLTIQDDRNVMIYAPGNVAVWELTPPSEASRVRDPGGAARRLVTR
jgi:hypothetical protein